MVFYKVVKHHSHCLLCKAPNPQFHHVTPKEKLSEVYKIAMNGDLTAVIDEINKCVPLCDPHHKGVHRGTIPGWLDGRYDNGGLSHAFAAAQYKPYLQYFSSHHPQIILRFYRDYIERDHEAMAPLMRSLGQAVPRQMRLKMVDKNGQEQAIG